MKQAKDCKLLVVLALITTTSCGKIPSQAPVTGTASAPSPQSGPAPAPTPDPPPTPAPAPVPVAVPTAGGPAAWSSRAGTGPWTDAVASVVRSNLASFAQARDRETFCPGYAAATLAQRETCWVRLVSAVAQFESDFNPATMYRESDGIYSVGLLQLSVGECANAETNSALQNPLENLLCGTLKMASLIARYGYVTTPDNVHGAAAYWSTLRAPYVQGSLHLGKELEVAKITAQYREVTPIADP